MRTLLLTLVCTLGFEVGLHAQPRLLGMGGDPGEGVQALQPSRLFEIGTATGAVIPGAGPSGSIGDTGLRHLAAMDFDPVTGRLYAWQNDDVNPAPDPVAVPGRLLEISPADGSVLQVLGTAPRAISDMAFDASGQIYAWDELGDVLVTIDKATGAVTNVTGAVFSVVLPGLAFNSAGELWMVGNRSEVFRIDITTGLPDLGPFPFGPVGPMNHLPMNLLTFDAVDLGWTGERSAADLAVITLDIDFAGVLPVNSTFVGYAVNTTEIGALAFTAPPATCGVCGDCDLDGLVPNILDALWAARIAAGLLLPSAVQVACCDVNSSGVVDAIDTLLIAQFAAGLSVALMCV